MNERLQLSIQSDVRGAADVDALGSSLSRIPAHAGNAGKALDAAGAIARHLAEDFRGLTSGIETHSVAILNAARNHTALTSIMTFGAGEIAKHSAQLTSAGSAANTLADGYRVLRLALSPTMFTAASVGAGISAEEMLKLANARGKLIEQQSLVAARTGTSFGDVERLGSTSALSGGNSSALTAALQAVRARAGTAKFTDALDSIGVPKYFQDSGSPRLLAEIAKGFSDIADPAARAKAAVDLFGDGMAEGALSQLNRRFADSSKAVDDWGLTLSDTSKNQIYEFRRDLQNFKDDVLSLGTGFEALGAKIEQTLAVGGAKAYSAVKSGAQWYFGGLDSLDERFGTRNPYSINEDAKHNIAEAPDVIGTALRARPSGETVGAGVRGDTFSYLQQSAGTRDDLESRLSAAKSLQAEIKKALDGGNLSPAATTSLSTGLLGAAQEISAAKANLKAMDDSRRRQDALLHSRELVNRSVIDPSAGQDFRGEIQKATTYADSQGDVQRITMLDETRRNLETGFRAYAASLGKKASDDLIKDITDAYSAAVKFDADRSQKQRAYLSETASIEAGAISKALANRNTIAGYVREESLSAIPTLDSGSPTALRDRLAQISRHRDIQTQFFTTSSLNDAAAIESDQQRDLIGVAMAPKAGNITPNAAAGRYSAIQAADGAAGGALNDRFEHDLAMANQAAAKETSDVLREAIDKQTEALEHAVTGLIGAIASGNASRGIQEYLKSELVGFSETITKNFVHDKVAPVIEGFLPKSGNSLLRDTFLYDPVKALGKRPAGTATDPIYVAAAVGAGPGAPGGGGSLSSPAGIQAALKEVGFGGTFNPSTGTYSGIRSLAGDIGDGLPMSSAGIVDGDIGDGLPMTASGRYAATASTIDSPGSGLGFNTGTIGLAAAAGAGSYAAVNDFMRGGIGKDLQGAGAVAGIAGAVLPLISSSLALAGPIGAIAGIGLSMVGSLLDNPRRRANQLSTEIGYAQYDAPTALNITQSSGGGFSDFDSHGNLRTSDFSPYPQVTEPFTFAQTHGTFSSQPPTFYQVPGSQTSQFGPAETPVTTPEIHVHVHAIDTQSGIDFLNKNGPTLHANVVKGLQNFHGSLTREIQRATRR